MSKSQKPDSNPWNDWHRKIPPSRGRARISSCFASETVSLALSRLRASLSSYPKRPSRYLRRRRMAASRKSTTTLKSGTSMIARASATMFLSVHPAPCVGCPSTHIVSARSGSLLRNESYRGQISNTCHSSSTNGIEAYCQ